MSSEDFKNSCSVRPTRQPGLTGHLQDAGRAGNVLRFDCQARRLSGKAGQTSEAWWGTRVRQPWLEASGRLALVPKEKAHRPQGRGIFWRIPLFSPYPLFPDFQGRERPQRKDHPPGS